jgi:hypothetical protein
MFDADGLVKSFDFASHNFYLVRVIRIHSLAILSKLSEVDIYLLKFSFEIIIFPFAVG